MYNLKAKQINRHAKYQYSTLIVTPMAAAAPLSPEFSPPQLLLRWFFTTAVVSGAGALADDLIQSGEGRGLATAD